MKAITTALLACLTACAVDNSTTSDSTFAVRNESDYEIHELYVTSVGSSTWGPNLLGGDVLLPDETIHLDIDCGTYDAMLVDETNTTCEISNLSLCFDDADWVIRNNTCTVFAAREGKSAGSDAPQTDTAHDRAAPRQ